MNRKTGWMYAACGLIVAACALVFAFVVILAQVMIEADPFMASKAVSVYLYFAGAALPCLAAVGMLIRVVHEIGHDRSFTRRNARLMRGISLMAAVESVYILAGLIGWGCADHLYRGEGVASLEMAVAGVALVLFGAGVSILAWALSRLILHACAIQEENDLTI